MTLRNLTKILILSVGISLIVFNIIVALFGVNSTISEVIYGYAFKYPIIPFSFGVFCGHWFWPVKP